MRCADNKAGMAVRSDGSPENYAVLVKRWVVCALKLLCRQQSLD
jgi:hypothetical protein